MRPLLCLTLVLAACPTINERPREDSGLAAADAEAGDDADVALDAGAGLDGSGPAAPDASARADASALPPDGGPADSGAAAAPDAGPAAAAVGPRVATFVPSGPLVLASGQVVSGLHVTASSGPCIRVSGAAGVRIHDCKIGPCGPDAEGVGVAAEGASDLRVEFNAFDDVSSALYAYASTDGIVFDHNLATRVRGPMPRGQLVQFNAVHGSGHRITCNVSDQTTPGYLDGPEDHVNMFSSGGTAASPIVIAFNKIRGGGPSHSGGGLLAGDNDSEHVDITDNVLVDPGQYGVAIAGGRSFRVLRNRIYSPVAFDWSNVGLYVWNQSSGAECSGHEVSGNRVLYMGKAGPNPCWNAGNCGAVSGWDTGNVWGDTTLGPAIWDETFADCL